MNEDEVIGVFLLRLLGTAVGLIIVQFVRSLIREWHFRKNNEI